MQLISNYYFDIDEIYNYLNENIINFSDKKTYKSVFSIINTIVKNRMLQSDQNNNYMKKIVGLMMMMNLKESSSIFQQSAMFQSNGSRKILTTPGEKVAYLVRIEITDDTRDLKGITKNYWCTKIAYKTIFLIDSIKDPKYVQLHKMILNVIKDLSKIKNVKKDKFTKYK